MYGQSLFQTNLKERNFHVLMYASGKGLLQRTRQLPQQCSPRHQPNQKKQNQHGENHRSGKEGEEK